MDREESLKRVSRAIGGYALMKEGTFTFNDVIKHVEDKVKQEFSNREEMENYVLKKLNQMCEVGLIGRTSTYYFSL